MRSGCRTRAVVVVFAGGGIGRRLCRLFFLLIKGWIVCLEPRFNLGVVILTGVSQRNVLKFVFGNFTGFPRGNSSSFDF